MWFRNARPYKLPGRLGIDASELSQRLARRPFVPCRLANPRRAAGLPHYQTMLPTLCISPGTIGWCDCSARAFVTGLGHS